MECPYLFADTLGAEEVPESLANGLVGQGKTAGVHGATVKPCNSAQGVCSQASSRCQQACSDQYLLAT